MSEKNTLTVKEIATGNSQQRVIATQARNWVSLHETVRHKRSILEQSFERYKQDVEDKQHSDFSVL